MRLGLDIRTQISGFGGKADVFLFVAVRTVPSQKGKFALTSHTIIEPAVGESSASIPGLVLRPPSRAAGRYSPRALVIRTYWPTPQPEGPSQHAPNALAETKRLGLEWKEAVPGFRTPPPCHRVMLAA